MRVRWICQTAIWVFGLYIYLSLFGWLGEGYGDEVEQT